ncbi:MAG: hypothetical protein KGL34_09075 [Gammaproteobacteria bacterium]|nr:hypothetical protein [Gammaproteobacteria bacterium]
MILRGMQSLLGRLYDVETRFDVYDFLITDRSLLRHWEDERAPLPVDESLLLAESADGAAVALYIDAEVLGRLERADPFGELNDTNLADYCTALEGVSHFLYCTWRLHADAPVSLLELETQAEVDKYWTSVFLIASQQGGGYPWRVFERLFGTVGYAAGLEGEQLQRYRTANRCAAQYCRRLERRFLRRGGARIEALLRELRRFYRMGAAAKLRHAVA